MAGFPFALLLLWGIFSAALGAKRPNILFIVADDLGWNDIGWNNRDVQTPNLDKLAAQGVTLNHSYVQPVCSPSRTAFMTGMYPFRSGMQHGAIRPLQPKGVPLNFTFLPQKLKEIGYATHIVGKWHLGFCNITYTPMRRGFDSHYGIYVGAADHYLYNWTFLTSNGYDFRNNGEPDATVRGTYSTFLFADKVSEIIRTHNADKPLFIYLPFQAVHSPLQVPARFENLYPNVTNKKRRTFLGMVSAMDEAVGNITMALDAKGILNNTIIAFTTDNGGRWDHGGNNWPLRGEKGTIWEGGTRGPAFVTGGVFDAARGRRYNGLFHAVDWFPTFLAAAGHPGTAILDGINQIDNLIMPNSPNVRTELIYNADNIAKNAAFRIGQWKLIVGKAGTKSESGWKPAPTVADENFDWYRHPVFSIAHFLIRTVFMVFGLNTSDDVTDEEASPNPGQRQLFDLSTDPTEHHDLSKKYPNRVDAMYQRLLEVTSGYKAYLPTITMKGDPKHFNGFWSPGWCPSI